MTGFSGFGGLGEWKGLAAGGELVCGLGDRMSREDEMVGESLKDRQIQAPWS